MKQSIEGPHSNQFEGNANFCNSLFCFFQFKGLSDSLSFSSSVLFHNLHACALVHFQEFKYILINGKGHFMRTNAPKWKHVTFYLSLTLILSFFKLILKHSHCDHVQEIHG